jgi:hypothetical protein
MFSTAPATAATVEEIALLRSTERQKILVEGAKLPWFFLSGRFMHRSAESSRTSHNP